MTDKGKKILHYLITHGALYDDKLGYWLSEIDDEEFDEALEERWRKENKK